jgi:hypothetical protein
MKKDYVISVSGAPGPCYFTWVGDDDEARLETTSDAEAAARFEDFVEARHKLRWCVANYPERQFKLDVVEPLPKQ